LKLFKKSGTSTSTPNYNWIYLQTRRNMYSGHLSLFLDSDYKGCKNELRYKLGTYFVASSQLTFIEFPFNQIFFTLPKEIREHHIMCTTVYNRSIVCPFYFTFTTVRSWFCHYRKSNHQSMKLHILASNVTLHSMKNKQDPVAW